MAQYEVTGVRYQMGEGLTWEETTLKAEEFIRRLEDGTPLILAAEPDNPKDSKAIAVYMDYTRRVGYIKRENCKEVYPMLDGDGQCDAVVCGNDGHVTFYIEIPDAPEVVLTMRQAERVLPPCPLPEGVGLGFSNEERALGVVASRLVKMAVNAETAADVLLMAERYMPLSRLSLCYEDDYWRDHVLRQIRKACRLKLPEEQKGRFEGLCADLRATMGDFHRSHEHWVWKVFESQLSMLRVQAEGEDGLFACFEKYVKGTKEGAAAVVARLQAWFESMPHVKLRNPQDRRQLAETLNYQRVSRQELYEVYAALLLLERYQGLLHPKQSLEELVGKLKPIFYNDEKAARAFLEGIQGMQPKQVTDWVKRLVSDSTISDLSSGRKLYTLLHDNGLYAPTESNWNQQLK